MSADRYLQVLKIILFLHYLSVFLIRTKHFHVKRCIFYMRFALPAGIILTNRKITFPDNLKSEC